MIDEPESVLAELGSRGLSWLSVVYQCLSVNVF